MCVCDKPFFHVPFSVASLNILSKCTCIWIIRLAKISFRMQFANVKRSRFVDLTTTFSPRYFFLSLFLFSHQLYSIHDTVTCYARQFVHFILLLFIQHTHIKLLLQTTLNKLWLKMFGNLFIFKVMFILLRLGHSWVSPCINSHEVRTKGHSSQTKIHWQSSNTNNKWNANSKLNLVKRFNISKHQRLLGIALHHFWPTFATFSV